MALGVLHANLSISKICPLHVWRNFLLSFVFLSEGLLLFCHKVRESFLELFHVDVLWLDFAQHVTDSLFLCDLFALFTEFFFLVVVFIL